MLLSVKMLGRKGSAGRLDIMFYSLDFFDLCLILCCFNLFASLTWFNCVELILISSILVYFPFNLILSLEVVGGLFIFFIFINL